MPVTDPFTGAAIPAGTPVVRCPHGHISLLDSWQAAGNRCCYPGCGYAGDPIPAGIAQLANVQPLDIRVIGPQPVPGLSANIQPLYMRVLSSRRHWWPIFWSSLGNAAVTILVFTAVTAVGWSILLSSASVPSDLLSRYIPIDGIFALLAAISVIVSALVLAILRVFWPKR